MLGPSHRTGVDILYSHTQTGVYFQCHLHNQIKCGLDRKDHVPPKF